MEDLALRPTALLTHRLFSRLTLILGPVLFSGCATLPRGGGLSLQEELEAIISAPPLDQVHWGILVVDPDRREVLFDRNANGKFVPASNMKILSTATALSLLGPDHRYETGFWSVGSLDRSVGVLQGDLVLRASGDPTFSDRFYSSWATPLDSLAEGLWAAGVRSVSGSLIVDVSAWDSTTVPGTWMVANLPGTSGATGGAFALAEGELTVEVSGGTHAGVPARVRWWPETPDQFLSASFVTAEESRGERRSDYLPESRRLRFEGTIRPGAVDTIRVSQRDPVRLAAHGLLMALERKGIRIDGGLRISWDRGDPVGSGNCVTGPEEELRPGRDGEPDTQVSPQDVSTHTLQACPEAGLLTTLLSPTLAEIIEGILEPSQNWMTEQLVRTLGAELGREGSWSEGFRVEEEFLTREVGVDTLDLSFRDGSGLSAYNLVTPRALVRILEFMRSSTNGSIYRAALAEPGEDPGTLRSRFPGLEGRIHAKTGTITHVNSLSGYLVSTGGRELIFSILTNASGLSSGPVREAIDRIVEVLARR